MTAYPEAHLARELELCYANVSMVTDYDAGVGGDMEAVAVGEVIAVFNENLSKLHDLLFSVLPRIPPSRRSTSARRRCAARPSAASAALCAPFARCPSAPACDRTARRASWLRRRASRPPGGAEGAEFVRATAGGS